MGQEGQVVLSPEVVLAVPLAQALQVVLPLAVVYEPAVNGRGYKGRLY